MDGYRVNQGLATWTDDKLRVVDHPHRNLAAMDAGRNRGKIGLLDFVP
jgi:hypothetical protein